MNRFKVLMILCSISIVKSSSNDMKTMDIGKDESMIYSVQTKPADTVFPNNMDRQFSQESEHSSREEKHSSNQYKFTSTSEDINLFHNNTDLVSSDQHFPSQGNAKYQSSHFESSSSSFSEQSETADGHTEHHESATLSNSMSDFDGKTQHSKVTAVSQTAESKSANGSTESKESSTIAQAEQESNSDGTSATSVSETAKSASTSTAHGVIKRIESRTAVIAESTKDSNGEECSKVTSAADAQVSKTSNGNTETAQASEIAHSTQTIHADGQTEHSEDFTAVISNIPSVENNDKLGDTAQQIKNTHVTSEQNESTDSDVQNTAVTTNSEETEQNDVTNFERAPLETAVAIENLNTDETNNDTAQQIKNTHVTSEQNESRGSDVQNIAVATDSEETEYTILETSQESLKTEKTNNDTAQQIKNTHFTSEQNESTGSKRKVTRANHGSVQGDTRDSEKTSDLTMTRANSATSQQKTATGMKENLEFSNPSDIKTESDKSEDEFRRGRYDLSQMSGRKEIYRAIQSELSYKTLIVDDGTKNGKCYCTCGMNGLPVFMTMAADSIK